MKRISTLIVFQALLAVISAILLSQMSWLGRQGINFIYKEYSILKVWWQTALVIFFVQMVLIMILWLIKWTHNKVGIVVALFCVILGFVGTHHTYIDFTATNHKVMGTNFHTGGYLIWVGWEITCLYFIFVQFKRVKKEKIQSEIEKQSGITSKNTEN